MNFLQSLIANLQISEIDYEENINPELDEEPVLHIPRWPFCGRDEIELILFDYAAIMYRFRNVWYLETAAGKQILKNVPDQPFSRLHNLFLNRGNTENSPHFLLNFLAYEAYGQQSHSKDFYNLPDIYTVLPGNGLLINHNTKKMYRLKYSSTFRPGRQEGSQKRTEPRLEFNQTKKFYLEQVEQTRELIRAGEVYQLNYTMRISTESQLTTHDFFNLLYDQNPAPFSFYACLPHADLISNSPERFMRYQNGLIHTSPVKGTAPRGATAQADRQLKSELLASEKESAELSMIVDLLRNDLSRICQPGTVQVQAHKQLQTFANVHHLVSTIAGNVRPQVNLDELYTAVLPGGSISGCPKEAATSFISQLEPHNRSFYTGTLFCHFPQRNEFDSSILIRTAIKKGNALHFQTGGGIVIDSEANAEYAECMAKADSFIKTVEKTNASVQ